MIEPVNPYTTRLCTVHYRWRGRVCVEAGRHKNKIKTGTDDDSSVPMMEPCAAFGDDGFQAHGCDIQGDKQPVETPAGKKCTNRSLIPSLLSHTNLCFYLVPSVEGKLKIIQRRKGV